ncbi:MAG: nickel/cobalt transporter [Blastocatellia bacterium]
MRSFTTRAAPLLLVVLPIALLGVALAHPLGNFTINHFVRINTGVDRVRVHYVVDYAEVPAFQEAQRIDADSNGAITEAERESYLETVTPDLIAGLKLTANGAPVQLRVSEKTISQQPGAAGLMTMRIVYNLDGSFDGASALTRFWFENANLSNRAGWRELVVAPLAGVTVFDSTAFGNGVTDELKAYPKEVEEQTMAPLNERAGEWAVTRGAMPAGAKPLTLRDGKPVTQARDRFAELIAAPVLTPGVMLLGLLLAFVLGGVHAMSPGHGKAVVGAYLVGARGTASHAAFLGLTVTITHTIGVFALGLVTLFAARYVLPETLIPVLGFVSGALVVAIGLGLFVKRLRALLGVEAHEHQHGPANGSRGHTHLPPGTSSEPVTWRSLLALGVSGGIVPCPSALVVMLAAISMNRVGYGLVLIVAFSLGLAGVLTAIGLAFVYAGKLLSSVAGASTWLRVLPVVSAAVITVIGVAICWQALQQSGVSLSNLWHQELETTTTASAAGILLLGLVIGLQHAMDTDHLAAVSTIVSERKSAFSSMLIGAVWGVGHTASLLLAGIGVILLRLRIEKYEKPLEFCVALMLIGLGANVLYKLVRGGKIHLHEHAHGAHSHFHPHVHGAGQEPERSHHGLRLNLRPLIIGMVHGLAGSAALMLVVLAKIKSVPLQFAYIGIFGIGSIGGMMVMSLILSLPIRLTANHFTQTNWAMRALAGVFSLGFGLFMAYEIGYVEGLLR